MATLEDELKDLKDKNNELALKVQYWKMTAAQKEDDRISLMKENNELRLKLSRLRNNGGLQARKLDTALQTASEKALSHLVKASTEIARTMEIAKAYIRDRQELDAQSPRWSSLSTTPNSQRKDKIHRVPPMMGGQSIQPVVALSRTLFNTSNPVTSRGPQTMTPVLVATSRGPGQNLSSTERAVPMHMLQDVYIPLTRIDVTELQNNNIETDTDTNNADDITEELDLDDSGERMEEEHPMSDEEDFEERRLQVVTEDLEPEDEIETPPRNSLENPLEGPSWLLDTPTNSNTRKSKSRSNLEPDSTTEMDSTLRASASDADQRNDDNTESQNEIVSLRVSCEFSPTVRRRKRTSSPPAIATPRQQLPPHQHQHHYSPRPLSSRRNSNGGRVLKVLVAKMRLDGDEVAGDDSSPPKRARSPSPAHAHTPAGGAGRAGRAGGAALATFDAPSPNGATDTAVIVIETRTLQNDDDSISRLVARNIGRRESRGSRDSRRSSSTKHTQDHHSNTSHDGQLRIRTPTFDVQQTKSEESRSLDQHRAAGIESRRGNRIGSCDSKAGSVESRDSDSGSGGGGDSIGEGRTRRTRKTVTYKEKPLNRKMRR